jgi:hypothetical protein
LLRSKTIAICLPIDCPSSKYGRRSGAPTFLPFGRGAAYAVGQKLL